MSPSPFPRLAGLEREPTPTDYRLAALEADQHAADARFRGQEAVAATWSREADSLRAWAVRMERRAAYRRSARVVLLVLQTLLGLALLAYAYLGTW